MYFLHCNKFETCRPSRYRVPCRWQQVRMSQDMRLSLVEAIAHIRALVKHHCSKNKTSFHPSRSVDNPDLITTKAKEQNV